jgi:hypothetical protein
MSGGRFEGRVGVVRVDVNVDEAKGDELGPLRDKSAGAWSVSKGRRRASSRRPD